MNLDQIRAAAERIAPVAHRTPVLTSRAVQRSGRQQTATSSVKTFSAAERSRFEARRTFSYQYRWTSAAKGVAAYSSGNHAQAVAIAARHLGMKATIAMPTDAPHVKVEATKAYGAEIVYLRSLQGRP